MSTQLKLRRGTTAQHSTFTGAEGEITVDTTKDTVVVHDGVTAGGVPLAKESALSGYVSTSGGVISANASSDALRITQTGAGNALVVEDSANPDSSPFVVNGDGRVVIGGTAPVTSTSPLSIYTNAGYTPIVQQCSSSDAGGAANRWNKDRSGSIVLSGDEIWRGSFRGYDGSAYIEAAAIYANVDGTPGTNDMPGRLVFSTTADGASSPAERMRIDSAGRVGIGGTPFAGGKLHVTGTLNASANLCLPMIVEGTVPSTTTTSQTYRSSLATQAAAFTLGTATGYHAEGVTVGAGSTVTNQFGFRAESNVTGATNNYGFYSNIASGTGRYNFYASGTADNFFANRLLINRAYSGSELIGIGGGTTGRTSGTAANGFFDDTMVNSAQTAAYTSHSTYISTQAAAFTLGNLTHYKAAQFSVGAGSAITSQYGYFADGSMIGATNNYGFYSNIASGTGRYNFYAAGSADNYFAGKVGIGTSSTLSGIVTIEGVNTVTDSWGQLAIRTSDVAAIDKGALIALGGKNGVSTNSSNFGTISGRKENATDGNSAGYLAFGTTTSGNTNVERMRIDSSGNVIQTAPTTAPTLSTNGTMVFNLTSNTNLRVSVRGSDGVTRTANITLA